MRTQTLLIATLGLMLLASPSIRAEDDETEESVESEEVAEEAVPESEEATEEEPVAAGARGRVTSHPDVSTSFLFPAHADNKLPFGKSVDVLVGFHNAGSKTFNITGVQASLNSPFDYSYFIQNFSRTTFDDLLVGPGDQTTLLYTFTADMNLEPMDFQLSVLMAYEDEDNNLHGHVALNETLPFYEPASEIDAKKFFTYTAAVGVLCLLGLVAHRALAVPASSGASRTAAKSADGNEWTAHLGKGSKRKVAGRAKSSGKGKKVD